MDLMTFCVSTGVGTWTKWSTFEPDPDHSPDAEPDCFLRYRMHCNAEFYYVGKISRTGIEHGYWTPVAAAMRGFEASKHRCWG